MVKNKDEGGVVDSESLHNITLYSLFGNNLTSMVQLSDATAQPGPS